MSCCFELVASSFQLLGNPKLQNIRVPKEKYKIYLLKADS